VCCSLRKDVVRALMTIARRAEQRGRAPDHVVLETTGLADPAPVAFTFLSNPWVAARFVVDAIM
jgi:G3E family GTPase